MLVCKSGVFDRSRFLHFCNGYERDPSIGLFRVLIPNWGIVEKIANLSSVSVSKSSCFSLSLVR